MRSPKRSRKEKRSGAEIKQKREAFIASMIQDPRAPYIRRLYLSSSIETFVSPVSMLLTSELERAPHPSRPTWIYHHFNLRTCESRICSMSGTLQQSRAYRDDIYIHVLSVSPLCSDSASCSPSFHSTFESPEGNCVIQLQFYGFSLPVILARLRTQSSTAIRSATGRDPGSSSPSRGDVVIVCGTPLR